MTDSQYILIISSLTTSKNDSLMDLKAFESDGIEENHFLAKASLSATVLRRNKHSRVVT